MLGDTLNVCFQNDILCRHFGNICAGLNIYPAGECIIVCIVINNLGEFDAYGQQERRQGFAISVYKIYAVDVVHVNGNVNAGVSNYTLLANENIQSFCCVFVELSSDAGLVSAKQTQNSANSLLENNLCIKGNALVKYESRVATVEVHQAVVCNHCTKSGSQQTICNLDGIALYKVVNCTAVFYLIHNSGVEICERIAGCSSLLEQVLHIKVIAEVCCNLFDNVINGVIKIAVDSAGQTVGDLDAGNVLELLYEYFESGNFSECIDQVLCFEVVREVIAGHSLNICEKYLCIARSESLAVYLTKGSRINCIENSNYFLKGQSFSKRDEITGLCCVNSEDLVLECIELRIVGGIHLLKSKAENACKLGGDGDICNQLTVCKTNIADLIHQNGKLSSYTTDHIRTCSENEAEVDSLVLLNTLFIEVRNSKSCIEQLAAVIKICKFVQSGNEVFKSIDQSCGKELDVTASIWCGNNNTVNLDFGDGLLHSCKNVERLNDIVIEVKHAKQFLCNTGFVNNLNKLLYINLGNESTNIDSLDESNSINELGDFAILDNILGDVCNANGFDDSLITLYALYVVDESHIATGNRCNDSVYTLFVDDGINSSRVVNLAVFFLQACTNSLGSNSAIVKTCQNLSLDATNVDKFTVVVVYKQFIDVNNLVNELSKAEQRIQRSFTKENDRKIQSCADFVMTIQKLIVQTFYKVCIKYSFNIQFTTNSTIYPVFGIHKAAGINACFQNSRSIVEIHISIQRLITACACQKVFYFVFFNVCRKGAFGGAGKNFIKEALLCSGCINNDTVKSSSLVNVNKGKQSCLVEVQSQFHQFFGVIFNEFVGIKVLNSCLEIVFVDVLQHDIDSAFLNVGLQVHILEKADEPVCIYASKQFVCVKASEKLSCVDVSNNRLNKVDYLFFGDDRKEFFLGHNASETTAGIHALQQSLQVSVLEIGQQGLRINGNGNVGNCFVISRFLLSLYVQPSVSDRTDRQNCQYHYECQQHRKNSVELFHNTKPHFV